MRLWHKCLAAFLMLAVLTLACDAPGQDTDGAAAIAALVAAGIVFRSTEPGGCESDSEDGCVGVD
ncbi:MAG: hypothetical protein H7A21_17515 [Spirochaetales bacterium]|nr:hypothetical protein [Leptospiraceae bacterium]MCP5483241.1 hypothetical protein [Spirochaetales bacterium]MCP5486810.1 hypothetical protein [Spirochaetales bacterium]